MGGNRATCVREKQGLERQERGGKLHHISVWLLCAKRERNFALGVLGGGDGTFAVCVVT